LENRPFIYWADRFKDALECNSKKKVKKLVIARIALMKPSKCNGRKCYLFAALDVERNKIMKVYPARNALTAYSFSKEVLKMCEVEEIILNRGHTKTL